MSASLNLTPEERASVWERVRFWFKYVPSGCWEWTGPGSNGRGYALVFCNKRRLGAHRFMYLALVGPIPQGLHLDHLCRTPWCVNPYHLEPVTRKENILRGVSPQAINAAKTHCQRGHLLGGNNVTGGNRGRRSCRTCHRLTDRIRYHLSLLPTSREA